MEAPAKQVATKYDGIGSTTAQSLNEQKQEEADNKATLDSWKEAQAEVKADDARKAEVRHE